ncbi:hypothetical protein HOF92_09050, partial [bacterium]|nr:hypothetical protein [bacterium]
MREFLDIFYAGGLEYQGAVILEMILPKGDSLEKHNLVFVNGVGLAQHFVDEILRATFEFTGFRGIELVGFKVGNLQRGSLQGVSGVTFQGLNLEFSFLQPDTFTGPLSMTFFQRGTNNTERRLSYSIDGGTTSTAAPLGNITPGGENIQSVFFSVATQDAPDGLRPESGKYNLIAKLTDVDSNQEVRNVDLFTHETDFYWFLDFAQTGTGGGGDGPVVFNGERFSFLKHQFIPAGDNTWDMELDFSDAASPQILVQGASTGNGNRVIRRVQDEGSFRDAQSLPGQAIATNGLSGQRAENLLDNESVSAVPGGIYLIKIPQADRQESLNGSPTGDAYVLMLVKEVDPGDQRMEFSYLLSIGSDDGHVGFFDREINGIDPDFFDTGTGDGGGDAAPSRQGYVPLMEGDCGDLELDSFDFVTGEFNERRPFDACSSVPSTADLSVTRLEIIEDTNAPSKEGEWRGRFLVDVAVPGGFVNMPFKIIDTWNLPFALHETLLPGDNSPTNISMNLPFGVRFDNAFCDGGLWSENTYAGREDAVGGNDFLFQLSTYIQFGGADATDPTGTNSTAGSFPTSLGECVEMMHPRLDLQYSYFSFDRQVSDLATIPHRGDFNGTGIAHPASGLNLDQIENHVDDPDTDEDDRLGAWASALSSLDASILETFVENYCDTAAGSGTATGNTAGCEGPARFRVGTDHLGFEHWGSAATFEVRGFDATQPLHYRLEAFSPTSFREQSFSTDTGVFGLGFLNQSFQDQQNQTGDGSTGATSGTSGTAGAGTGGSSDGPRLHISFGPQWPAFETMEVTELRFSVPLSRLGRDLTVSSQIEVGGSEGGFEDEVRIPFDPQNDAVA